MAKAKAKKAPKNIKRRKNQRRKMAITKTIKNVSGGVDLLRPQMNLSYIMAGTVSIIVLMLIWKLGGVIFAKGDSFVQGRLTGVPTTDYKAALGIV